jgi:hypothetical protein
MRPRTRCSFLRNDVPPLLKVPRAVHLCQSLFPRHRGWVYFTGIIAPLQGCYGRGRWDPGRCPGLWYCAPLGLGICSGTKPCLPGQGKGPIMRRHYKRAAPRGNSSDERRILRDNSRLDSHPELWHSHSGNRILPSPVTFSQVLPTWLRLRARHVRILLASAQALSLF